jgi:hypothetical protein
MTTAVRALAVIDNNGGQHHPHRVVLVFVVVIIVVIVASVIGARYIPVVLGARSIRTSRGGEYAVNEPAFFFARTFVFPLTLSRRRGGERERGRERETGKQRKGENLVRTRYRLYSRISRNGSLLARVLSCDTCACEYTGVSRWPLLYQEESTLISLIPSAFTSCSTSCSFCSSFSSSSFYYSSSVMPCRLYCARATRTLTHTCEAYLCLYARHAS